MSERTKSTPLEEGGLLQLASFALLLVALGPIGTYIGAVVNDAKVFLWGVGTSLMWIGAIGFIATIDLPTVTFSTEPYATILLNGAEIFSEKIEWLFSFPETYLVLFVIGLVIVIGGLQRVLTKTEPIEFDNE